MGEGVGDLEAGTGEGGEDIAWTPEGPAVACSISGVVTSFRLAGRELKACSDLAALVDVSLEPRGEGMGILDFGFAS